MRKFRPLLLLGLLLVPADAGADPIQIPLPLDSPVSIDLTINPIVTFGTRTIDFTSSLNQEFIDFLIAVTPVGSAYRNTVGVRARDGLSQLSGAFPSVSRSDVCQSAAHFYAWNDESSGVRSCHPRLLHPIFGVAGGPQRGFTSRRFFKPDPRTRDHLPRGKRSGPPRQAASLESRLTLHSYLFAVLLSAKRFAVIL